MTSRAQKIVEMARNSGNNNNMERVVKNSDSSRMMFDPEDCDDDIADPDYTVSSSNSEEERFDNNLCYNNKSKGAKKKSEMTVCNRKKECNRKVSSDLKKVNHKESIYKSDAIIDTTITASTLDEEKAKTITKDMAQLKDTAGFKDVDLRINVHPDIAVSKIVITNTSEISERQEQQILNIHTELNTEEILNENSQNNRVTEQVNGIINTVNEEKSVTEKQVFSFTNEENTGREGQSVEEDGDLDNIENKRNENNANKKIKRTYRTSNEQLENERRKHPQIEVKECCSKKCFSEYSDIQRQQLHAHFWQLNRDCRRIWIKSHVSETLAKRKVQDTRRTYTRTYKLPMFKDSERTNYPVCQQFFLKMLGYRSTSVIDHTLKCCKDEHGNQRLTPLPDKRGRQVPKNKKDIMDLREHIKSYKPIPSHYKREHAPNRLYLPSDLSIKNMHLDYNKKFPHNTVGYELYRKTVDEMNIAFYNVHSVKCGFCIEVDMSPTLENLAEKEVHLKEVQLRRHLYQEDAAINTVTAKVFAVDMQKVFMLPRMPQLQEAFFLSRLVVFNETFASMQKNEKHHCILWHEATAGRKAEEVTCSFLKFLDNNRDANNVILWLDNCSGQNKNWILFSSLLCYVNSTYHTIQSITLKFLLTGHTFMAADGLHGKIEQTIRKKENIEDFSDFIEACQISSKRMCITEMKISDFRELESKFKTTNRKKENDNSIPYLKDVVCVKFIRGDNAIYYKTDFKSEEYIKATGILKKGAVLSLPKETYQNPRGIATTKKRAIVDQLLPKMKLSRRAFWVNLPENPNASDILDEGI